MEQIDIKSLYYSLQTQMCAFWHDSNSLLLLFLTSTLS